MHFSHRNSTGKRASKCSSTVFIQFVIFGPQCKSLRTYIASLRSIEVLMFLHLNIYCEVDGFVLYFSNTQHKLLWSLQELPCDEIINASFTNIFWLEGKEILLHNNWFRDLIYIFVWWWLSSGKHQTYEGFGSSYILGKLETQAIYCHKKVKRRFKWYQSQITKFVSCNFSNH